MAFNSEEVDEHGNRFVQEGLDELLYFEFFTVWVVRFGGVIEKVVREWMTDFGHTVH